MAKSVQSAAVYARISSDQDGTALGVARQVEDCRRLPADLGWKVAEEYVDNDLSAYSGRHRPEYQRMLLDLADGARDAVLVYHVDRLTRRPIELEQFLDVLTAAKVRQVRFVAGGELDIGNGDGLMVLRMLLAVVANESATEPPGQAQDGAERHGWVAARRIPAAVRLRRRQDHGGAG
jgi:DNA invertase Pin-like site-specific DNA recombinase